MSLLRKSQLAAIVETFEGVYQAPSATNLVPVLVSPNVAYDLKAIERNTARGSFTMPLAVPSFRSGKMSFQMEAQGAIAGIGTPPAIDLFLQACGMARTAIKSVPLAPGAPFNGTVLAGETFTQATSGATGIVVGDYLLGESYLVYIPVSGTVAAALQITFSGGKTATTATTGGGGFAVSAGFAWTPADQMLSTVNATAGAGFTAGYAVGDVVSGQTSGAIGTVATLVASGAGAKVITFERALGSAHFAAGEIIGLQASPADATHQVTAANPTAETQAQVPSLTMMSLHDGSIRKAIKGSRGSWKADLKNGDRALFSFDFEGCGVQAVDGINFAWPGDTMLPPNVVTGGRFSFDQTYLPNFSQLSIDYGTNLTLRESPNDSTGTGYESCYITGRNPKGQIDPETVKEALYSFGAQAKAWFKSPFRMKARCGPRLDGNTFEFWTRQTQIETPAEGDRGGILASTFPLLFRGGGNDEVIIIQT